MSIIEADDTDQMFKATFGKVAKLSEPDPYEDQPPRLIAAIDDSKLDPPAGTKMIDYVEARKQADARRAAQPQGARYPSKVGEKMAHATVPLGHVIHVTDFPSTLPKSLVDLDWTKPTAENTKAGHEAVLEVLAHVAKQLKVDRKTIWESQEGASARWWTPAPGNKADDDIVIADEEAWARIATELMFGITYGGPGETYVMGSAGQPTPPGGAWNTYIYQRTERGYPVEACWVDGANNQMHGAYNVPSWKTPYPSSLRTEMPTAKTPLTKDEADQEKKARDDAKSEGKLPPTMKSQRDLEERTKDFWSWHDNSDDPAVPIVAACQHLSTLVSVLRGYPLSWMSTATTGPVGYQASEAVASFPIFGTYIDPGGLSPYGAARALVEKNVGLVKAGEGKWIPAGTAILPHIVDGSGNRKAAWEAIETHKLVPGTVFVWDPDRGFNVGTADAPAAATGADAGAEAENKEAATTQALQQKDQTTKQVALTVYMTEYEATFTQRATFAAFFQTRSSTGGTHFKGSVYLTPNARVGTPPPEDKQAAARAYTKTQVAYFKKEVGKLQAKLDALPPKAWGRDDGQKKRDLAQRQLESWEGIERRIEQILLNTATTVPVVYQPQQLPGSHITAVLRTTPDRVALQLMDTGFGQHLGVLCRSGSEAIVPIAGMIISDSYRHPDNQEAGATTTAKGDGSMEGTGLQISSGTGRSFAGMGVPAPLPATRSLKDQIAHLEKARPIGLARFVLTRRKNPYVLMHDDILFMSGLRPMYDTTRDGAANYPIAKLLWSLRNTPGFTTLQPWWLIYAPRELLARSMYAYGARDMTLRNFVEHFRESDDDRVKRALQPSEPFSWPPTDPASIKAARKQQRSGILCAPRHYMLLVVLSNHGSEVPAYAGKAKCYKRYRYTEGNTSLAGDGEMLPPGFSVATAGLGDNSLSWGEMLIHPKVDKDALMKGLPSFFKMDVPETALYDDE